MHRLLCVGSYAVLSALCASMLRAAQPMPAGARYTIKCTTDVTISLPCRSPEGEHLYRDASGRWAKLPNATTNAQRILTFTLSPEQLSAGTTTVLLDKPEWLNPNDCTPPKITEVIVDGRKLPSREQIDLGWIEKLPQSIQVRVVDDENPLDPSSVLAVVNGKRMRPGTGGFRFEFDPKDNKAGRFVCSIPQLVRPTSEGSTEIVLWCDDFAPDDRQCAIRIKFCITRPPTIKLDHPCRKALNGVRIWVDSAYEGYDNVECIMDGKPQVLGRSTRGVTWASAETEAPHWMCFVFPQARKLSGVQIAWTNYKGHFWTSRRYEIMTWDGRQWVRALRVQNNPEGDTSRHTFRARTTNRVLVWTPPGGNHAERPNLMWVAEVRMLP